MNSPKLVMMRGLPASGKTTKAQQLCSEKHTVRVNRDLLREMIHFGEWLPQREEGIIECEKRVAAYYLSEQRQTVIIDDTNLGQRHEDMWRDFVNNLQRKGLTDLEFEVIDVRTDPYTCVERDMKRDRRVGKDVIYQMALEHGRMPEDIYYIFCDIDGTLANITHRRDFVRVKPKKWKEFYAAMPQDTLRREVYDQVEALLANERKDKKVYLVLFSARPANYRKVTEEWLERVGVDDYFTMIMRRAGDYREDSLVKRELLHKYFKDKSKIIQVFDDRPRVVRMWQEEGLAVTDVNTEGEF